LQVHDSQWSRAADYLTKSIGMVHEGESTLKVTFNTPDDPYYFLGRWYAAPNSSMASYCDVLKAIRKLSVAKNSDRERYMLKLHGYWTTDSDTPVLSEFLQALARMYGITLEMYFAQEPGMCPTDDGRLTKWAWEELDLPELLASDNVFAKLYRDDRDMFYRVAGGVYVSPGADDARLMHEAVARQLGMSSGDLEVIRASLRKASTWDEIDAIRICGQDWDPSAEPEGTIRVDGPVKSLLDQAPSSVTDAKRLESIKRAQTAPAQQAARKKHAGKQVAPASTDKQAASAVSVKLKRLIEDRPTKPPDTGKRGK